MKTTLKVLFTMALTVVILVSLAPYRSVLGKVIYLGDFDSNEESTGDIITESDQPNEPGEPDEPVHQHTYNAVVTPPTCEGKGYTTYTCSGCNDSYVGDETAALGHEAGASATCTTDQKCIRCDYVYVAALGHNTNGSVTPVAATCTTTGVVGGTYCTACGKGKAEAETIIPATNHNTDGYVEPITETCTEDGRVGGKYCSVCNYNIFNCCKIKLIVYCSEIIKRYSCFSNSAIHSIEMQIK